MRACPCQDLQRSPFDLGNFETRLKVACPIRNVEEGLKIDAVDSCRASRCSHRAGRRKCIVLAASSDRNGFLVGGDAGEAQWLAPLRAMQAAFNVEIARPAKIDGGLRCFPTNTWGCLRQRGLEPSTSGLRL